jgi:hypothetical protein
MKAPSFVNLLAESGWEYFGKKDWHEEPCPCDWCARSVRTGWHHMQRDDFLCADCFEREVKE